MTTEEKDLAEGERLLFSAHMPATAPQWFAIGCACRDRQVIAYLRKRIDASFYPDELTTILNAIEAGEHVP